MLEGMVSSHLHGSFESLNSLCSLNNSYDRLALKVGTNECLNGRGNGYGPGMLNGNMFRGFTERSLNGLEIKLGQAHANSIRIGGLEIETK